MIIRIQILMLYITSYIYFIKYIIYYINLEKKWNLIIIRNIILN